MYHASMGMQGVPEDVIEADDGPAEGGAGEYQGWVEDVVQV